MKNIFYILFFMVFSLLSFSQDLPAGFAKGEKEAMNEYLQKSTVSSTGGIVNPPTYPNIRTMAEWEEIQTLVITWTSYTSIHREIVRYAQQEATVSIICSDSNTVKSYLTAGSVPLSNLRFIYAPFNSIWMRDYGANTVYGNKVDSLFLVDWIYNRPRPKDDTVPSSLASALNIKLFETKQAPNDLIHTGGNFMSDGWGTAFSSQLTDSENPTKTASDIDSIMKKFMGINRYIRFAVLPFDGIHHIDMHMKLLDEETLLVGEYPLGTADGPQIEANLQYILSNFNSVYGTPYKVIRIPMPPDKFGDYPDVGGYYCTYTNAVFVNKTVILPTYYTQYDTTALRVWKEALPGYKIIGIDCDNSGANIISQSGAIHCITHSVGVEDPLLIKHQRLVNTCDTINPYTVQAEILHRSGIQSADLYWTADTTLGYQSLAMNLINPPNNLWSTSIPAHPSGTELFYYIKATANTGKTISRPMPAPLSYYNFKVNCQTTTITDYFEPLDVSEPFPNPATAITCFPIRLKTPSIIKADLCDVLGKSVYTLYEGTKQQGEHKLFFNAENFNQGVYFLRVRCGNFEQTKKIVIY